MKRQYAVAPMAMLGRAPSRRITCGATKMLVHIAAYSSDSDVNPRSSKPRSLSNGVWNELDVWKAVKMSVKAMPIRTTSLRLSRGARPPHAQSMTTGRLRETAMRGVARTPGSTSGPLKVLLAASVRSIRQGHHSCHAAKPAAARRELSLNTLKSTHQRQ